MVDIRRLKSIMVLKNVKSEELATVLGVSKKTISNRFNNGIFASDEIEKITDFLGIENPMEVFFPKYLHKNDLQQTG